MYDSSIPLTPEEKDRIELVIAGLKPDQGKEIAFRDELVFACRNKGGNGFSLWRNNPPKLLPPPRTDTFWERVWGTLIWLAWGDQGKDDYGSH